RILVCAPSNAGIDEILKRLTLSPKEGGGIFDETGKHFSPSIIRVGPNIHPDLAQYSLEYKASQRMKVKQSQRNEDRVGIKHALLKESQVVCATQSVCGSRDMVSFHGGFDTVVIDEASQGVELSTLIPLRLGCQRLILVGDPRQLSATVISKTAIE
ncbi:Rna-directed Rna polymerase, partial [Cardiosporidium cionae]